MGGDWIAIFEVVEMSENGLGLGRTELGVEALMGILWELLGNEGWGEGDRMAGWKMQRNV